MQEQINEYQRYEQKIAKLKEKVKKYKTKCAKLEEKNRELENEVHQVKREMKGVMSQMKVDKRKADESAIDEIVRETLQKLKKNFDKQLDQISSMGDDQLEGFDPNILM